jgi:hypothetical protein
MRSPILRQFRQTDTIDRQIQVQWRRDNWIGMMGLNQTENEWETDRTDDDMQAGKNIV